MQIAFFADGDQTLGETAGGFGLDDGGLDEPCSKRLLPIFASIERRCALDRPTLKVSTL